MGVGIPYFARSRDSNSNTASLNSNIGKASSKAAAMETTDGMMASFANSRDSISSKSGLNEGSSKASHGGSSKASSKE
jgi:hypothetical protein